MAEQAKEPLGRAKDKSKEREGGLRRTHVVGRRATRSGGEKRAGAGRARRGNEEYQQRAYKTCEQEGLPAQSQRKAAIKAEPKRQPWPTVGRKGRCKGERSGRPS